MKSDKKTVREWAELYGKKPDTVRVQATRKLGRTLGQTDELSAAEWLSVYPDKSGTPLQRKREKESVFPASPAAAKERLPGNSGEGWRLPTLKDIRRALLDCILIGIVIGHAGLIWYDCADLWDVPGRIGGGLAFFIIVAAVMLSTDPEKNVTSQIALFLAFMVDAAAWWVHFPVFQTYSVDDTATGVLCGFLCAMSFGALLIYRHQKNN